MNTYICKTRGDSSPQGKPRVFLSFHEKDRDRIRELMEDIWYHSNCAFYYAEESGTKWELERLLKEVQLMVIPVTEKYLFEENPARDVEFELALRMNIPVLPIVVEKGVGFSFANACTRNGESFGKIQYIDRTSEDITEVPYSQKLENKLNQILVRDDLFERIKAAFDAYIFLSYRKKDRAQAKKLMKMVHDIPYCRDIAIWYDEFLTPGDSWNDEIAAALTRSAMVLLAVTPSVTEPGNFVVQHEYPDAVKAKKPIIPYELLPSSREELEMLLPGIAETVKTEEELYQVIKDVLQSVAVRENDNDCVHNYLIGLAYMNGIDVEKDSKRAIELLSISAKQGFSDAARRLVTVYKVGNGVEIDYEQVIFWEQRLVEICRMNDQENPGVDTCEELFQAYDMLGRDLIEYGSIAEAREIYEEMLQLSQRYDHKEKQTYCMDKIASCEGNAGNRQAMLRVYLEMLKIQKEEAKSDCSLPVRRWLSLIYERVATCYQVNGELEIALEHLEKAYEIQKILIQESTDLVLRRDYALMEMLLSSWYQDAGRQEEAERLCIFAREQILALAEEFTTAYFWGLYAGALEREASLVRDRGHMEKALEIYQKAKKIHEQVVDTTHAISDIRDLVGTILYLIEVKIELGRLEEARGDIETAENIIGEIAERTGLSSDYLKLCEVLVFKGNVMRDQKCHEAAKVQYEKALRTYEKVIFDADSYKERHYKFLIYDGMIRTAIDAGEVEEAEELANAAFEIVNKNVLRKNQSLQVFHDFTLLLIRMGTVQALKGDYDYALFYYGSCMEEYNKLAKKVQKVSVWRGLAAVYGEVASLEEKQGHKAQAKEYVKKQLNEIRRIVQATEAYEDYEYFARVSFRYGITGDITWKDIEIAYKIYDYLVQHVEDPEKYTEGLELTRKILAARGE